MRGNDLLIKMENIDPAYIEAADVCSRKRSNTWVKWGVLAACLCLVIAGTVIWQKTVTPAEEGTEIVPSVNGVTIPQMEVSLSEHDEASMIAFFIYNGNCYVEYERINGADILGEYIGTATGLIDEWTPQEGYVEFAGSVKGDFFAVKGYDPEFMLCMKDAAGTVSTYICNNGITLKNGADLYEDRLHLSDNYSAVQYETRESWFNSKNDLYQMNGNDEVISNFIEQMDKAEFMLWDDVIEKEGMTESTIYDTELYHIYFKMDNGTTTHLRLYENGYVRFEGILDVCVQVPEDSFNSLVDLMNTHTDSELVAVIDQTEVMFEKCKSDPELGAYIPKYEIPGFALSAANIYYYIEPQTGAETGTKEICLEYDNLTDHKLWYGITITWKDEYGINGWAGPMIDNSELSVEIIKDYESIKESIGTTDIDVGVWFDDVSVVLGATGIDAESAFDIFNSVL